MNNQQIYFFQNLGNLIMAYKILIVIMIFVFDLSYSEIIYDKNNITISQIELNEYHKIFEENYNINLTKNDTLKRIILMKKAIKYIEINDMEFLNKIDENLINQFGEEEINNRIKKNFLRFLKIRYEYISSYFTNQFNINDLEIIFNSFQDLKLPISKNNCNTIEKLVDVKKDKFFIKNLYENLKNSSQNFKTKINNEVVSICFNNKTFKLIEDKIISYIEKKTESDFNKLIYGKIN